MGRRRGWGGSPPNGDDEATQRIVAAAVEEIGRTGAAVTIGDVADALDVTRQTVYRYFPTTDALLRAAGIASVAGFLDGLAAHVRGLDDPAEAMTEGVLYTLRETLRTPHLRILLVGADSHAEQLVSAEAQAFGREMLARYDVDWTAHGYDEHTLDELVEYVLRTMQSFVVSPTTRTHDELRHYLHRWLGVPISAQPAPARR